MLEHGRPANDCHSLSQCTTTPLHNASGREKPKRSIFQDCKWRKQKTARFTSKECIPHPWEETTKKNAAALRPSSTNQEVSLWRAFSASRRAHLLPLGALTSKPKESSGSAACLREKKAALPLSPSGTKPVSAPFSKT